MSIVEIIYRTTAQYITTALQRTYTFAGVFVGRAQRSKALCGKNGMCPYSHQRRDGTPTIAISDKSYRYSKRTFPCEALDPASGSQPWRKCCCSFQRANPSATPRNRPTRSGIVTLSHVLRPSPHAYDQNLPQTCLLTQDPGIPGLHGKSSMNDLHWDLGSKEYVSE